MTTAENRVMLERKGTLAVIRLNRPEARNALSPEMVAELGQAIASCRGGDIRAVLLTGTDGAFCSGADVRDFTAQLESGGPERLSDHLRELADDLRQRERLRGETVGPRCHITVLPLTPSAYRRENWKWSLSVTQR